jgi:hypothetical protein
VRNHLTSLVEQQNLEENDPLYQQKLNYHYFSYVKKTLMCIFIFAAQSLYQL